LRCIVGIGNPGKEYKGTRHNVGFKAVDSLKNSKFFEGLKDRLVLKKPSTFVNRTGLAVAVLAKKYKLLPESVLVICDDVHLEFGKMRLRAKGSSGGHKGLASVIEALGTDEFPRLRIGVKNDRMPKDLASFVLEGFSPKEVLALPGILEKADSVCRAWGQGGMSSAMDVLSRLQSMQSKKERLE